MFSVQLDVFGLSVLQRLRQLADTIGRGVVCLKMLRTEFGRNFCTSPWESHDIWTVFEEVGSSHFLGELFFENSTGLVKRTSLRQLQEFYPLLQL